jgi:hypothetical protein
MTSPCPVSPRPINTLTILQFQASVHDNVSISDHLYSLLSIVSYAGKHPYMIQCPFKFLIGRALCHVWVYHRIHRNPQIASSSHSSTHRYPGWLGVLAVWEKLQQRTCRCWQDRWRLHLGSRPIDTRPARHSWTAGRTVALKWAQHLQRNFRQ